MSGPWVVYMQPPPPNCPTCGRARGRGSGLLDANLHGGVLTHEYNCACGADSVPIQTSRVTSELCVDLLRRAPMTCPGDYIDLAQRLKHLAAVLDEKSGALEVRLCGSQPQSLFGKLPFEVTLSLLQNVAADDAFSVALACKFFHAAMCEIWKGSLRRFTTSLTGLGASRLKWALDLGLPPSEICEVAAYRGELELVQQAVALGCPFGYATMAAAHYVAAGISVGEPLDGLRTERATALYNWLKEAGAPTSPAMDDAIASLRATSNHAIKILLLRHAREFGWLMKSLGQFSRLSLDDDEYGISSENTDTDTSEE